MRFTCEKSMLVQGLNIAGRTVAQKSSLSVLEGILCNASVGLTLTGYRYRGIVTFVSDRYGTEYMHLFHATGFEGILREDCDEGVLEWITKQKLLSLPMWEGDKIFLDLLTKDIPYFYLKLEYRDDTLLCATLNGSVIRKS